MKSKLLICSNKLLLASSEKLNDIRRLLRVYIKIYCLLIRLELKKTLNQERPPRLNYKELID